MITNPISSSASNGAVMSATQANVMGKDDFLNLLITQLQNQDPLNPTDSTEFTAQLAQFSSLEQLGNVNENLMELKQFQAATNNSQAVALIGKAITAAGNSILLSDDGPVPCNFHLADDAAVVMATIYDGTGKYVTSFEGQNVPAGQQSLFWDGRDDQGNRVADGPYTFEILAADAKGRDVGATTYFSGLVDRVTFEDNTSYLISGAQKVALADVIEVAAVQKVADTGNPNPDPADSQTQSSNPLINGGR
jgi:flagellar basal-body rod modification protein FlgD